MKSICYIIPYFGRLPINFPLWLLSCKANPTINWIILTDDRTQYDYPQNVKVIYSSYEEIIGRIKANFNFDILIDRPWRLSLFKPAYGEIFQEELRGFDFWGYCDIDLMWGNIRAFYTDEVLSNFQRIGFLGHSTLYKNTVENNSIYRTIVPNEINHIDVFSGKSGYSFDENGMDAIYNYLKIPYYHEVILADLEKYEPSFVLGHFPTSDKYKNAYQIFTWNNGRLLRYYLYAGKIYTEEFLYIHFFCRPMSYECKMFSLDSTYYIYPDVMTDKPIGITVETLRKYGKRNGLFFLINSLWVNRHKLTGKRILNNLNNLWNYITKK